MQAARSTTGFRASRARTSGFTLTELMVVVTVMGVLVAMSAPRFGRSLEQSRADFAVANLRAIWAAQRLYWLENHKYAGNTSPAAPVELHALGLLDPEIVRTTGNNIYYIYTIKSDDSGVTFEAKATRATGTAWTGWFTIDQTGTFDPAAKLSASGQPDITPGFQ